MKTHTIRWNSSKTVRIVTFTPSFMKILLSAKHDLAIRCVIANIIDPLKRLTKANHTINWEQKQLLEEHAKSITKISTNKYQYFAEHHIVLGVASLASHDMLYLFDCLNTTLPIIQESMKDLQDDYK